MIFKFMLKVDSKRAGYHVPSSIATWKPINHATAVLLFASICNFYLIAAVLIVKIQFLLTRDVATPLLHFRKSRSRKKRADENDWSRRRLPDGKRI